MTETITPKMRAVLATEPGTPDVLTPAQIDRPSPGNVEISVRVHAASVNPADWKVRANGWIDRRDGDGGPVVLGWDVSGVVESVGRGVTLFKPGDEVFGMPLFPKFPGAYAEYVVAPPRHFVRKPEGLDHVQAAALPLVSLTAYQALVDMAGVRPGQRVLIHAAAGGVGHVAVQIAKALGAYVIGTASAAKHDFVRGLGADEVIDYTAVEFEDAVADIDVVLDTIGGGYAQRSLKTMRSGGTLVALTEVLDDAFQAEAAGHGIRAGFMLVEPDHASMLAVTKLVEEGELRPEVAAVLPLEDAAKAHELGETGRTTGKLVLRVVDEG